MAIPLIFVLYVVLAGVIMTLAGLEALFPRAINQLYDRIGACLSK
jgi:hypothetical protein